MRFAKRIGYLSVVLVFAFACAGGSEEGAEGAMESGMDNPCATTQDTMMADSATMNPCNPCATNPCSANPCSANPGAGN